MKKVLAFFVVAVLLTQSVWAAVGGVCAHQQANAQHEQHFGHHHHESGGHATGSQDAASNAQHNDCGACHLVHSPAIVTLSSDVPLAPTAAQHLPAPTPSKTDWLPSGIERPNWRA